MNQVKSETQPEHITLPPRMKATLEQYQKRVWVIKLAEGALAAIFGLVVSYLVVFGLDRLLDTPTILRVAILIMGSLGMVILFPLKYHNWVWSHRHLDQVARLLRHKFPRFGDHLLGIVELANSESEQDTSRALIEAAMQQVDAELENHDLTQAVPYPRHRRWAWATGVPLALMVIVMVVLPAASRNTLVRWLTPWRDVERYTFAQLEGESHPRVIPYAEPFNIEVSLKENSPWKPESGKARYERQSPILATRNKATYRFEMLPQTNDGDVSLQVGDARRAISIALKMRPSLTALVAQAQLPAYLERNEPLIEDVRGGQVSLVKGSSAVFKATATRDLAEATLNNRPQPVKGSHITTENIIVGTSAKYQLAWRDHFGLTAHVPQEFRVEALDDEIPTVGFNKLKNNQVILSSKVLAFEIQASDDFGVKQIGLEWEGIYDPIHNPEPSSGEKTVAAGTPTAETMAVPATFSAEREKIRPQSLRLRAFVEDYLPDRERTYSPYLVLHVLTPAEHFKWLTEQMGLWVNAAQEVHDKELQLNQANRELRDLPPEALDDPAQRIKIQQQAAAELANTAKLESLIEIGKELVREAMKNEEFDSDQLESWAEIIKKLEEIAGQKMPSVAEFLAQAAEAPGKSTEPPPQSTPAGKTEPGKPTEDPPEGPPAPPGGEPNDLEKADKYGPENKTPEGLDETPEDPNTPGSDVNVDRSKLPDGKPGYLPANPVPLVLDFESGFNESENAGQPPQIVGGMGIPVTILKGSGREDEDDTLPAAQTAELVLQAVQVQQELLETFAELTGEMNKLLMNFENSTFVKRLKAASRRQIDMAADLNTLDGFGAEANDLDNQPTRIKLAGREVAESETVFTILEDMVAYADRRPSDNYSRVLNETENTNAPSQLQNISNAIKENLIGQSTIEAEFWADTLDRWAEQLVDPLPPPPPPGELTLIILPNLPPKIILQVLRIIDGQIQLRDETRELNQAKKVIKSNVYQQRVEGLHQTQQELGQQALEVIEQIEDLPNVGEELIQRQLNKVIDATDVMDEVKEILATPDTGPQAIAAESEVIEILLETGRLPNEPLVMKVPPTSTPALMLIGSGDDGSKAFIENRAPEQAIGKAGRILPEEFRQGLDAYFDALEGNKIE